MPKKEKTIKDVENEVMNDLPDDGKKEKKEEKQEELKGMPEKTALVDGHPAKTKLEKEAVKVGEMFENLKKLSDEVAKEKNKLLDLMKAEDKQIVVLKTVENNTYDVSVTSGSEKISFKKHKEEML